MYLASRMQAGRMLAAQIVPKYSGQKCAIVALNDGGVIVGTQIALQLHCVLTLLMSAEIMLPREPTAVAGITDTGVMSYNTAYAKGELDEMVEEYRGFIEQEKLHQMHELNHLVSGEGTMKKSLLRGHNVIVVSDGVSSGFDIDLVYEFLKPIALKKLIYAIPFASVQAVDRMHVLADELYCLSVIEDYRDTDHYYDKRDVPDHSTVIETISRVTDKWR